MSEVKVGEKSLRGYSMTLIDICIPLISGLSGHNLSGFFGRLSSLISLQVHLTR